MANATEGGVFTGFGDADVDRTGQVAGSAEHFVADVLVGRQRFTGDVGLVDGRFAADDFAVCGDVVTGTDADDHARAEFLGFDFDLGSVGVNHVGFRRRQAEQAFDGCPGTEGGSRLDQVGDNHKEGDDAGFLILAEGDRRRDGQRDQLVHVHFALGEMGDSVPNQRHAQQARAQESQHIDMGVDQLSVSVADAGVEEILRNE